MISSWFPWLPGSCFCSVCEWFHPLFVCWAPVMKANLMLSHQRCTLWCWMDNISFRHTLVSAVPLGVFLILIFSLEFSEHVGLVHAGSLVKKKKKKTFLWFSSKWIYMMNMEKKLPLIIYSLMKGGHVEMWFSVPPWSDGQQETLWPCLEDLWRLKIMEQQFVLSAQI